MNILVNGQRKSFPPQSTVGDLLLSLKLEPVRVAIEVNEDLVPRKTFGEKFLHDGDRVEIVTFVGGG